MIVAYGGRMLYQDWRPTPQINLLWANTGLLLLSSLCLQVALMWARAGKAELGAWSTGRRRCFDPAVFSGTARGNAAVNGDGAGGLQ